MTKTVENSSASTLQRAIRVKNAKRDMHEILNKQIKSGVEGIDDYAATTLQKAIRVKNAKRDMLSAKQKRNTYLFGDDPLDTIYINQRGESASTLQAALRRKKTPQTYKITPTMVEPNSDTMLNELSQDLKGKLNTRSQTKAATQIQKIARGVKSRKEVPKLLEQKLRNDAIYSIGPKILEKANASTTLQAAIRRKNADKEIGNRVWQKAVDESITKSSKPSALKSALNKQMEEFSASAKLDNETKRKAANIIKAATSRKTTQNEYGQVRQDYTNLATKLQGAVRTRTAKNEMMKQRKTVDDAKLKQMEVVKGRQIKALDTITGALNQKAARNKVINMKMDKLGNLLHFKKEASKSTFRGLLKTNDKRLGTRGYAVNVPQSERARVREGIKKDYRTLTEQYSGGMQ
jgi:hypothetical protein